MIDAGYTQVLFTTGESETVEFKKTTCHRQEVAKTLCAFFNQSDGTILFGVDHRGSELGLEVASAMHSKGGSFVVTFFNGLGSRVELLFMSEITEQLGYKNGSSSLKRAIKWLFDEKMVVYTIAENPKSLGLYQ